jgi:hypothetical protein
MSGLFYCVAGGPLGLDSKLFYLPGRPAGTPRPRIPQGGALEARERF